MFELRIYTIHEGRMNAIRDRFADHTLGIFERLGMKVVDFWIDAAGQPKLYYLMAYADIAERQRLWERFRQDPEWMEAKRQSEADGGPIVAKVEEYFMERADFFRKGG
ncbi:NIPSNAP family protein [Paenibacillus lycopersici]|uniref:NIPSNAP family protein n=1 Tax=Paenibacillus lycopersici TaxID=2704462 RepID=A0A6C0FXM5_9BACL|nr:NIPSNAP family protein [Paenibacillus lycopersici]QHT58950.1 NIPSNAP family protein [Paenibacillus lycopersici]